MQIQGLHTGSDQHWDYSTEFLKNAFKLNINIILKHVELDLPENDY